MKLNIVTWLIKTFLILGLVWPSFSYAQYYPKASQIKASSGKTVQEELDDLATKSGLVWKGDWSSSTSYIINDVVYHNGFSYVCTQANTNQEPPNSSYWDLFSVYSESDPIFSSWDKSSGISITASQVSDFDTEVSNNPSVVANTAKVTESTTVSAPLVLSTYNISIPKATSSVDGYLSSTDWSTFNSKQDSDAGLTSLANLSYSSPAFVKLTGNDTFTLDTNTYLTQNQTITLSGDVTGSGSTSIVTSIAAGVVGANELASTSVTAGSYTNADVTVDEDGRITSISNGTDNDTTYTADGQGIELVGTQFQLELNGNTLSKSASGLKVNNVSGVPGADEDDVTLADVQNATSNDFHNIGGVDADTTYSASGTLLNLAGTVFSLKEGTLTSGKGCKYDSISGLVCNQNYLTSYSETDPIFSAMDTEAELESQLSDVSNVYTNNDGVLSQWTTSGSDIYYTTGNVGVGIASPQGTLDTAGNVIARYKSGITHPTDANGYVELYVYNDSGTKIGRILPYTGSSYIDLAIGDWNSGDPNLMLKTGGYVGISEGNPGSKLSVAGNVAIGSSYSGISAPSNGMIIEGNVGIGTTSLTTTGLELGAGKTIGFEGATADSYETTFFIVDPTADRTITIPNATGEILLKEQIDTEAELEGHLSDVTNVYTNNDGSLSDDDLSDNNIEDLSNISVSSLSDGQLFKYNSTSGKWENWTPNYLTENQTITLTGDVTGSGKTSISTSLTTDSVGANELVATGVTAGSYTNSNVTVDEDGRITAISSGSGGGGEANTASNQGVGGVGVFYQKSGVDLQFKNINVGSNKLSVTDDTTNHEIDLDINEGNLTLSNIGGSVTDAQVPDTITASNYVRKNTWADHNDYPSACTSGQYVTAIGDTLTCSTPPDNDTTYSASGTLLDLTGTVFSVNEGTLTSGKGCKYVFGTGLVCDQDYLTSYNETDPVVASISGIVKSDGSTISAAVAGTDYVQTETDPQVGTVTNGNFCKGDGSAIQCTDSNTYLTSESDPQVDTLTANKWCVANSGGTAINCTSDAPSAGYDTVQDEGTSLTQRTTLNFIGSSVSCTDDSGNSRTNCTFTDNDTTYTASGTLLNLTGTVFSINEGTLTSGKGCKYVSGTGLVCDQDYLTSYSETDPVFSAMDTEAELESQLTDVTDVYTNNDGNLTDDDLSDDSVGDLSDVTVTTPSSGQVLKYNGSAWVNDSDSDTTYSASGTLLDLTGTTFSIKEGTLTNAKGCRYLTSSGISCDQDYLNSIADDTTPQLGGELDAQNHSIGFTLQTYTGTVGTTTIDWRNGNKAKFTFGAGNETLVFTAPSKSCSLSLIVVQDSTGGRTITWPSTVKWVGGTTPTLSTAANAVDIVSFLYDGSYYYGVASLNFQ